jgi:hypothetical protein
MNQRALATGFLSVLLGWIAGGQPGRDDQVGPPFDPTAGSLSRSEPPSIYASDPRDGWNQVFYLLFTRTIDARVMADGARVFGAGNDRLPLSDRRVRRIESGDRAIDPLYPSWLWMGSIHFDFEPGNAWRTLDKPGHSRLVAALQEIRRTAGSRSPAARALMQADLWSAYDMLHAVTKPRRGSQGNVERLLRAQALLPLLAGTMQALALSADEISRLPDTYSAAAKTFGLPDLLANAAGWMEIRWFPDRSHEYAAGHRRAARVFIQPPKAPADEAAFLNRFRDHRGDNLGSLSSVALLIQLLLLADDGTVVPSPITYEVQFRGKATRRGGLEIPQYELSRRQLLSSPSSGGLVGVHANAPAYLPIAGNDFAFATPPGLDSQPVLAPLQARCTMCHGSSPRDVGVLMTFSRHTGSGTVPGVVRLASADSIHAHDVAARKMKTNEFKALHEHWQE